jgi:hypothetical protein
MFQDPSTFDHLRFNSLPSIESADAEMRRQNKLDNALAVLEPIFQRHSMCENWGITLLHKHWLVETNELPITDLSKADMPREYDLRPRTTFDKIFYPSILAVKGGSHLELEPLEFSSAV